MSMQASCDTISDTKTALLDAAERLFAENGIAGTSLRAVTREAGANLASVSYHFGSREGLIQAVFARRLRPLNRARLELLERCAGDRPEPVELRLLLRAFVEPAVIMMNSRDPGDRQFIKLLSRTLFEPEPQRRALLLEEFRQVSDRFCDELHRLFPQAPREDIIWAFHFMVGSLAHTVAGRYMISHRLEREHLPDDRRTRTLVERLVGFLSQGWQHLAESGSPAA